MSWRRPPAAVRHVTAHPFAYGAVALTVLLTATATTAAAAFASTVTAVAVRQSLAASPGSTILVTVPATTSAEPARAARVTSAIRAAVAPGLPVRFLSSSQSQYLNLPAGGPGGPRAQVQIISLPGLAGQAALVRGRWPGGAAAQPVPVCLSAPSSRLTGLTVGATVLLRDSVTRAGISARVSCIFRALRPASAYWSLSPVGSRGVTHEGGFAIFGPLVTSPAEAGLVPAASGAWLALPDFSRLRAPNLAALAGRISAATAALTGSAALEGAVATTRLPDLLSALATALVVARSQLLIGVLILLMIAGAALTVTVRLLAQQREPEAALLAARGASRRQLAVRGLTDAAILALPAGAAGLLAGSMLAPLITHLAPPAGESLRLGAGLPASAWLAAAGVTAGCAVIISLPWLRRPSSPLQLRASQGRQQALGAVVGAGADLALLALAAIAAWQLAHYSAPVTTGLDGQLGADPILVSAPVLALAAGTLVTLRLLPLAVRLGNRAAARHRGLILAAAAWQISRRPLRQAGPAVLAVLAVATAVITLAENSSWHRSVQDQARFAVGADTRLTLPGGESLTAGQVGGVTAARGVLASTPALRTGITLASGTGGTLLALDGHSAAAVIAGRAGLPSGSLAAALSHLTPRTPAPGLAIPARPARLRVTARLRGAGLSAAVLAIELQDAAGVSYLVTLGGLPADGHGHALTATIGTARRADYPLRLTGFRLQYLPAGRRPAPASLQIESVTTAAAGHGPFGAALPMAAGPRLLAVTSAVPAEAGPALARASGHGIAATFLAVPAIGPPSPATFSVTAGPPVTAVPALATRSFLAASGARLGSTVLVALQGTGIPVTLTRQVTRFATITGPAGGLIVDQQVLQDALRTRGLPPLPVTEWWLKTAGSPRLAGLPPGASVTSAAALGRSLGSRPLSAAPVQALLAIAAAAVVLACGGFIVSAATSRDRSRDLTLLDALGARPGQVLRLLCLERAMLAVPAAAAGLLLGALLSRLIVPAVTLTAGAGHPDPPVAVQLPWLLAAGIAAVIAGVPVAAAALPASRRVARPGLRSDEAA